ncbi:MAG: hypothetical protein PHQ83_10025 [Eubacteriales bacterium]|nr:hypothetical protein [Eubacteriales bacterium]
MKKILTNLRRKFGSTYYDQYLWLGIAWSRFKITLNSFSKKGRWLKLDQVMSKKKSDTLFILGTGSSVNRYTAKQWQDISQADTMGLNDWIFHDFIPDILMAEILHDMDYFPNCYYSDLELVLDAYKKHQTLMIYKDGARGKKNLDKLPSAVQAEFLALYNPTVPILKISQIAPAIQKMSKILQQYNHHQKLMIFRKRATLFSAIELAWLMGYKKIVLCGIDLNHGNYFFDEDRNYYESKGFKLPSYTQHVGGHKTNNADISEVTVSQLVKGLNETLLKPEGIKLTVGSKESALAEFLPCEWETNS